MNKPLSLSEKLALKKKEAELAQAEAAKKPSEERRTEILSAFEEDAPPATKVIPIVEISEAIKTAPATTLLRRESDPKSAADLPERIKQLADLGEEDLSHAMEDLQLALMHNPDAVALMLPEDIGSMVAALRRLTGQAITQAAEKKTRGKSGKTKTLTEAEMEAAFAEL